MFAETMKLRPQAPRPKNRLPDDAPDEELVRCWQAGEQRERIFEILQQRYADELAGFFRNMGFARDACSDLFQDTLFQVYRGLDNFRSNASLRTWLYQVARSSALKKIRHDKAKKRRGENVPLDDPNGERLKHSLSDAVRDEGGDPLSQMVDEETRQSVRSAIATLSPADRRMVLYRMWHGFGVRETALAMQKPEGTIKSGWSRIRKTLGEKLSGGFPDLPP